MNPILHNAFRIAGLPATATRRELSARFDELRTLAAIGKTPAYPLDRFRPGPPPIRDAQSVRQAVEALHSPQGRFEHALLWFWVLSDRDRTAIGELERGDVAAALESWTSGARKSNGDDPLSCLHNAAVLSTLMLLAPGTVAAIPAETLRARAAEEWERLSDPSVNRRLIDRLARIANAPAVSFGCIPLADTATRVFTEALAETLPEKRTEPRVGARESRPAGVGALRPSWSLVVKWAAKAAAFVCYAGLFAYCAAIAVIMVVAIVSGCLYYIGTAIAFLMGMLTPDQVGTPPRVNANRPAVVRTATVNTARPAPPHEIALGSGAIAAAHGASQVRLAGRSSHRTGRYIPEIDDDDGLLREEDPDPDPDEDLGTALGDDPDPEADANDNAGLDEDFFSDGDSRQDAHLIDEEDAYDTHFFE